MELTAPITTFISKLMDLVQKNKTSLPRETKAFFENTVLVIRQQAETALQQKDAEQSAALQALIQRLA